MSENGPKADQALSRAVQTVALAESIDEIQQIVSVHPSLVAPKFLDQLDHQIDEIERTGGGDWWGLTRARALLGGYRDGALKDALFRCRTRDLLLIGPDDVRRRADEHPELLSKRADQLLRHLASEVQGEDEQVRQIELRRELLRELAANRTRSLVEAATQQEQESQRSGDLASLDNALAARRYLVRDPDAPFVSAEISIVNLQAVSRLLQQRFQVAGVLQDIADAVAEAEQGIAALPEGHPVRQILLAELGNALNLRFREFRVRNDIDRAISIFDALAAHPPVPGLGSEDQLTTQVNSAVALLDRYYEFKTPADLTRSIDLLRYVVSATPFGSARRLRRVNNLASALYLAFRDADDRAALQEAIKLQRDVVQTKDAAFQVHALAALARSLDAAAQVGKGDADESAPLFRQACQVGLQLNVGAAMWAGMTWGQASWARDDWKTAAEAYGYCADGARLLFSRQRDEGDGSQEIRLSQFRDVAPRAALALARAGRVEDAVVVFELSRAQLLIQAIERGLSLRRAPDVDMEIRTERLTGIAAALPALDFDEIAAAAHDKPLVYFVSTDRGGLALLVHHRKVTAVELPKLDTRALAERVRIYLDGLASPKRLIRIAALDTTTRWLWDVAMGPVLEELHGADEVVLVPGGLLGLLPVHAAWTPDATRPSERRYALDMSAFSYVPSARSLDIARARATPPIGREMTGKALIVADPRPVSAEPLKFANDEAEIVKWHLPLAEVLPGSKASLRQVSDLLSGVDLAHLACHGFANLDIPLESGVVLARDEILSVRKIRDLHVNARLAVLSACKTGVFGTHLPDEVVAMPTGLLQAGVAGIVASLWSVSDRATTMLMAEFYRRMYRENQAPAAALRGAQQWMRDTTNAEKGRTLEAGARDWLPPKVAKRLHSSLDATAGRAYSSPLWWAAFMHVGV